MFFSNRVSVCLPICQINQSFGKSTKLCFCQPYSKCSSRLIFGLRTSKFHRQKDNYSNLLIINKKMFFKFDLIIFINGLPKHQFGIFVLNCNGGRYDWFHFLFDHELNNGSLNIGMGNPKANENVWGKHHGRRTNSPSEFQMFENVVFLCLFLFS